MQINLSYITITLNYCDFIMYKGLAHKVTSKQYLKLKIWLMLPVLRCESEVLFIANYIPYFLRANSKMMKCSSFLKILQ